MNISYCCKCRELIPKDEIEVLEEHFEGDFEYFHIDCGGKVLTI